MNKTIKHVVLPMMVGVAIAFIAMFLYRHWWLAKTQDSNPKPLKSRELTPAYQQEREWFRGMKHVDAQKIIRGELLGLKDDPRNVGKSDELRMSEISRFTNAILLVGEISNDLRDAKLLLENLRCDWTPIRSNIGKAIAEISMRAAAKRGERVGLDLQFQKIWAPEHSEAGEGYVRLFLEYQPNGYRDTLADWLQWLTQDEQLPRNLALPEGGGGISVQNLARLKIIVNLEESPEQHHRKIAKEALLKLEQRYASDSGYQGLLRTLSGLRSVQTRKNRGNSDR